MTDQPRADISLARAVELCAADAEFLAELERILDRAEAAAREQGFECRACGQCCQFERFGHRLYVTAGEAALLLKGQPQANADGEAEAGQCPHQVAGQCSAREARTLGCRLFFCDPRAERWFGEVYEEFHAQIRDLHARAHLPYIYAEWLSFLVDTRGAST